MAHLAGSHWVIEGAAAEAGVGEERVVGLEIAPRPHFVIDPGREGRLGGG